jgi:hypothetical protein
MYTKINVYTRTLDEISNKITLNCIVMNVLLLVAYNMEPNWPVTAYNRIIGMLNSVTKLV